MTPLKPQESARGKPLDPTLSTPAKTVLHALRKGVCAVSYCGFRFDLLLAAAAALRRGFGSAAARKENRPGKMHAELHGGGHQSPAMRPTYKIGPPRDAALPRGVRWGFGRSLPFAVQQKAPVCPSFRITRCGVTNGVTNGVTKIRECYR